MNEDLKKKVGDSEEKEARGPWSLAGSADCLLSKDPKYILFTTEHS